MALKRAVFINLIDNLLVGGFLGEEDGLDVGQDTSLGDGDSAEKFVQFFVVSDGELEMAGDDTGLLVVTGGVSGQLEYLSGKVLQNGGEVHRRTDFDDVRVLSPAQISVHTDHGELESRSLRLGLSSSLGLQGFFTSSRHFKKLEIRKFIKSEIFWRFFLNL